MLALLTAALVATACGSKSPQAARTETTSVIEKTTTLETPVTKTVRTPTTTVPAPTQSPIPDTVVGQAQRSLLSVGCDLPGAQFQSQGTAWMSAGPSQPTLQGAGFAVTASHVVTACGEGTPVQSFGPQSVALTVNDVTHDVAVLSVDGEVAPPLPIATAPPAVGEQVALLGLAQQQPEVTQGQIKAVGVRQTLSGDGSTETLADAIEVQASAIHGESGGPAIDATGKVVGVIEGADPSGAYAVLTPVSDLPTNANQPPAQPQPSTTTPPSASPPPAATPSLPNACGPGLASGPNVSCGFANNVFYEYWKAAGGDPSQAETINAWGPARQQYYAMTCQSNGQTVLCTNDTSGLQVEFTTQSVTDYTSEQADAYARSGKLGPSG